MTRRVRALVPCVLLVAACASAPSGASDARDARDGRAAIVDPKSLPPRQREVWERWQAGGGRWELERERVRDDPELARFLVDNLVRTVVRSYDRSALATAGEKLGPFERGVAELVALAEHSTPLLVELLAVRDGVVAFLAADVLARIGARAAEPVSALLDDASAETRRRAAELLGRLAHAGEREIALQEALAERVRSDREWIVRAEAARALGLRGARHDHKGFALGVLSRALADPDAAVMQHACEGLRALGERRAVPALARALQPAASRGDVKGLDALQRTLRALTGFDDPSAAGASAPRTPDAWLRWYDAHPPPPAPPPVRAAPDAPAPGESGRKR